jgi:hypothetical protein
VEAVLLMLAGQRRGFTSCFWWTRQEWEALGGTVKEGPGTAIVVGGQVVAVSEPGPTPGYLAVVQGVEDAVCDLLADFV